MFVLGLQKHSFARGEGPLHVQVNTVMYPYDIHDGSFVVVIRSADAATGSSGDQSITNPDFIGWFHVFTSWPSSESVLIAT
eukprot:SAG11_NODE_12922_length_679_cov_0.658621_2_plen_80_part_01